MFQKRAEMFEKLSELVRQGKLQPPNVDKRSLDDWQVALEKGESGTGNKQLFIMWLDFVFYYFISPEELLLPRTECWCPKSYFFYNS